jgi:site-specific recombinase XerD
MVVKKGVNKDKYNNEELCEVAIQFLKTKKKSTAKIYKYRLQQFMKFYKKPIRSFIQEIEQQKELNKNRSITERKRVAETTIREYIQWLKEQELSPNTINSHITTIQSLLAYYQIPFSKRWIKLPPQNTLKTNKKHKWQLKEIKQFVETAEYIRDKAIVLCLFQSGLAIAGAHTYWD